jgi:hypothetical protein
MLMVVVSVPFVLPVNILLQVLPMRTHPQIGMSGGGGYLLTVTTITKPA